MRTVQRKHGDSPAWRQPCASLGPSPAPGSCYEWWCLTRQPILLHWDGSLRALAPGRALCSEPPPRWGPGGAHPPARCGCPHAAPTRPALGHTQPMLPPPKVNRPILANVETTEKQKVVNKVP